MELDKQRRKMEADLKICQQTLTELERTKKDIESNLNRKEMDRGEMIQRLEAQQASVRYYISISKYVSYSLPPQ